MNTWQHWVNFIVGLWVILSAYLNFTATAMLTNLTISGLIVAIVALWGAVQTRSYEERKHMHA